MLGNYRVVAPQVALSSTELIITIIIITIIIIIIRPSAVYLSEFLARDPEVLRSIPGATSFSEYQ
jgi:hypothetical protein